MVKPFLHTVTLDKISVFGYEKSEWNAALLKEIDADQLPVHFGGTMMDSNGDPKCSSVVSCSERIRELSILLNKMDNCVITDQLGWESAIVVLHGGG